MKMKFLAAGAAFCALGMAGCSNDGVDDGAAQAGKQVIMTLRSTPDAPQTRADYTEDATDDTKMNFSWRSGDAMSIVVEGVAGNENKKLTTTTDGKSVPFSGEVTAFDGTKTIYAFYPYSATPYAVTGGADKETATAALTLPATQAYTIGGAISNSFMVGVGTATATSTNIDASASLKQVMSIIKLNITGAPAKVTGVKLKCTDAIFATTATVKLSDATITNPGNLVKELAMTVTDNSTDHTAAKVISFALFPKAKVDGKKIQIEVTYEGGKSKMIEKDDIEFARNMHYVMEFDGTPVAPSFTWAEGNLVANGVNGCKVGAPEDGGLYFQHGSLIGWAGGASGNGTGVPESDWPDYEFNATGTVVPSGKSIPDTWDDPDKWEGTTGNVPAANDPCTHYLGSDWRLPTTDEYKTLFNTTTTDGWDGWDGSGGWNWDYPSASAIHTDGRKFPVSGYRDDGTLAGVETNGYYWSASPSSASNGYSLGLSDSGVSLNSLTPRALGMSVRCVHASN